MTLTFSANLNQTSIMADLSCIKNGLPKSPWTRCKQRINILSNRQNISYLCLSITRSHFKNNRLDVKNIKLIYNDICQLFRANQRNDTENYALQFYQLAGLSLTINTSKNFLNPGYPVSKNFTILLLKEKKPSHKK